MTTINEMADAIHATARAKGWHEAAIETPDGVLNVDRVAAWIALAHAELSEALEDLRTAVTLADVQEIGYEPNGKPCGFPVELADTMIRIMDTARALDIDIQRAIEIKAEYNRTRPRRHGGKSL